MATHLKKGDDYLGYGGQGLIMSRDQFIKLINEKQYFYTSGISILNSTTESFTVDKIQSDYVVKLIACPMAWASEIMELREAQMDLGLTYVDPENMGGHFRTQKIVGKRTYGDGFMNFTLDIQAFSVIFMKKLDPVQANPPSTQDQNTILTKVIKPLMEQLATYHKLNKVHRDIKHLNMMMDGDTATLIDFGLATTIRAMENDQTRNLAGTSYFISCWYEMLNAMTMRIPDELKTKDYTWPYRFMNMTEHYPNKYGIRIINKRNLFVAMSEANMIKYMSEKMTGEKNSKTIVTDHVGTFMKMNDWFALALTIQVLYDVKLPALPDGYTSQGLFTKCYRSPNEKEVFCQNMQSLLSKDEYYGDGGEWSKILDSIVATNKSKKTHIPQRGGVKKVIYKILGRNRKVYKKKGTGNVLYVKVKGQEMTLKAARVLDAKHSKLNKRK
jgi:hypothetical protein